MLPRVRRLQAALSELDNGTRLRLHLIREFTVRLGEHFSAEEADGYFGALISGRPSLLPRVERLRSEHAEIIRTLEDLPLLVAEAIMSVDLAPRLGNVLDLLQEHERRENLLMQAYLLRDEGVPGD
jgi:hypothetical protein